MLIILLIIIILISVLHYYYLNDLLQNERKLKQNVAELIQKEDEINEKDLEYIHFKN